MGKTTGAINFYREIARDAAGTALGLIQGIAVQVHQPLRGVRAGLHRGALAVCCPF